MEQQCISRDLAEVLVGTPLQQVRRISSALGAHAVEHSVYACRPVNEYGHACVQVGKNQSLLRWAVACGTHWQRQPAAHARQGVITCEG